jgi:hypothetical protein
MDIILLHSAMVAQSRDLLASLGVAIPEGDDVTVTVVSDTVRIISKHKLAVAAIPAFPGYPTAALTVDGKQYVLQFPTSWAEVTAWAANPVPTVTKPMAMTHLAFRKRFTFTERTAIETAAVTDPEVRTVQKDFEAAQEIDLTYPDTIQGVGLLVAKGLLTQARANEILGVTS